MNDIDKRFKEMKKKFAVNKAKLESEYYYNDLKPRIEYKTEIKELPTCTLTKFVPAKTKPTIKYRKKPYFCSKCNRFHKYKYKGQPSKTHKNCFKHIVKYKDEYSQSELFKLGFKKEWNREANRSELQKRKGTKQ